MTATDAPPYDPAHDEPDEYRTRTTNTRPTAYDTDAERALLGAMALSINACDSVTELGLQPNHFHAPLHAELYQAALDCLQHGEIPDPVTIAGRTRNPTANGPLILQMLAECPSSRNAWSYAKRILTCAQARRLQGSALAIAEAAQHGNLDEAIRRITTLTDDLPTNEDDNTWAPVNLTDVVAGDHQPPSPDILTVTGAPALFYRGRSNTIFGASGGAKTWIAQAAIVEAIEAGDNAMFIDFEDDQVGAVARLTLLGLTPQQILDHFIYLRPDQAWTTTAQAQVGKVVTERSPAVAVIDSIGESMALDGVKGNDDDDVARWFTSLPNYLARLGPAVILIDHVVKDPNAPKDFGIGSQRKRAAIHGAAYRIDTLKEPSRTTDGLLAITTAKDRHGHHTKGQKAAMVAMTHPYGDDRVRIAFTAPEAAPQTPEGDLRPTVLMERASLTVEAAPGLSQEEIVRRTTGNAKTVRKAVGRLLIEGYIENDPTPGRFAYRSIKPFRVDTDPGFGGQS